LRPRRGLIVGLARLARAAALAFLYLAASLFARLFITLRAFEVLLNPRVAAYRAEPSQRAFD